MNTLSPSRLLPLALLLAAAWPDPVRAQTESSNAAADEPVKLNPFSVPAPKEDSFGVSSVSSVTRFDTPLIEVPQSVSVITSALLDLSNSWNQYDLFPFFAGVTQRQNTFDGTVIRGFQLTRTYNDGIRNQDGNYVGDSALFDAIEVIKGPAAAVIGTADAGGMINRVTKKPLSDAALTTKATYGSYGSYRFDLDAGGPLNADKSVIYRLVAAYQISNTAFQFQHSEHTLIAPSFEWKPTASPGTDVLVQAQYLNARDPNDFGFLYAQNPGGPITDPVEADLKAFNKYLATGDTFTGNENQIYNLRTVLTQNVGSFLTGHAVVSVDHANDDFKRASFTNQTIAANGHVLDARSFSEADGLIKSVDVQGDVLGRYSIGSVHADTLVGYEYIWVYNNNVTTTGALPALDLDDPVYGIKPTNVNVSTAALTQNIQVGWYGQQQVKAWHDRIILTGGIRYDKNSITTTTPTAFTRTSAAQEKWVNSPRVGLTFAILPKVNIYAVWSQQTAPIASNFQFSGAIPKGTINPIIYYNTESELKEAGVKGEVLNGGLTATFAAFDLSQKNFNKSFLYTTGEAENTLIDAESKGYEVELIGYPLKGLQTISSLTYYTSLQQSIIPEPNSLAGANLPPSFPITTVSKLKLSTLLQYTINKHLSVNFGVVYFGKQLGDIAVNTNTWWKISSQHLLNAGLGYKLDRHWSFNLSCQNLLNDTVVVATINANANTLAQYRTARFAVTRKW